MYHSPTIDSVAIASLNSEVSASITNAGILGAMTESGEDLRMAFRSGQVTLDNGLWFWLFENTPYVSENIDNDETINLYLAKKAGTVPDWMKLEQWEGNLSEQQLSTPDVDAYSITALNDEQSFDMNGYAKVAITTDSGEGFAFGFSSGEVDGVAGSDFGLVYHHGVWQIDGKDPDAADTVYFAKREGTPIDKFKVEYWTAA